MRERRSRDEPARESLKERKSRVRERVVGVVVDDEAIAEPVASSARSRRGAGSDAGAAAVAGVPKRVVRGASA